MWFKNTKNIQKKIDPWDSFAYDFIRSSAISIDPMQSESKIVIQHLYIVCISSSVCLLWIRRTGSIQVGACAKCCLYLASIGVNSSKR